MRALIVGAALLLFGCGEEALPASIINRAMQQCEGRDGVDWLRVLARHYHGGIERYKLSIACKNGHTVVAWFLL